MAKTKKVAAPKKMAPEPMETMMCCSHNTDLAKCWMCWLFKSLIALFCAFIVLWIGFCFGILKTQSFQYKVDPALDALMNRGGFCSPQTNGMSRTMSGVSIDNIMNGKATELGTKTGADFDREFLIQMVMHHENGIEIAKQALTKSDNEQIKAIAQSIIDNQTTEVEAMQKLNQ
jgi:hypothetical protein